MTYTLHKLSQGLFIVTSDEQTKEGDIFKHPVNILERASRDLDGRGLLKAIAQEPNIIFSALKEEEQKEIGWFDVEKLAKESIGNKYFQDEILDAIADYKKGFQKAQELLSDRRFSLDEVRQSFWKCFENRGLGYSVTMGDLEVELSKSLSQKSWKVELEMELNLNGKNGLDRALFIPKLTAKKKIKILKLSAQHNTTF